MQENQKTLIYSSINAKNWLLVYHFPTNTKKYLCTFKKCYCDVTSGYPRYPKADVKSYLSIVPHGLIMQANLQNQTYSIFGWNLLFQFWFFSILL